MNLLSETKGILIVDDEPTVRSVVSKVLSDAGYNTFPALNGYAALNILSKEKIDLAVIDIKMPILDGEDLLRAIKSKYPDIEVIMITAYATIESAVECLKQGAYDYILKPLNLDTLTNTVNRCMGKQILLKELSNEKKLRKKMTRLYDQMDELFWGTVRSLADTIELKDIYTAGHCERMRKYALMIADSITLDKAERKDLEYAAILHDIGKIAIPEKILLKPGKLSDDDWQIVRQHPLKGTQILLPIKQLKGSILGIKYHHERYDGTGYPEKLKGGKIPRIARILLVADAFDAMTSDRPYRKALSFDHAKGELLKNSGSQFDPELAKAFVNLI
jgi:response regulator RpfG family c-di-GMP phosphodiesterase